MHIEELLDQALALPSHQQRAFAERACGSDLAIRERLLGMLKAASAEGGFLDRPAIRLGSTLLPGTTRGPDTAGRSEQASSGASVSGRRIGAFELIRRLGVGGMGEVWLAQRSADEFQQTVALKIMLPGDHAALERFRIERQILAGLQHPGIAQVHDGGVTDDSWPWMAMEYVEGRPLLAWCEEHAADLHQRIELFLQVCDAVAYAHSHLVVHRDLKPANILVTEDARVKLLDFGIAKLLAADSAQHAAPTLYFSADYAAPEQLEGGAVTTATDVFSLGVTLYELTSSCLPWPSQSAPLGGALKRLMGGTPAPPSKVAKGPIAQVSLRGDLDAIILKALRREPEGRYADARNLAEDLRRHQRHEPVHARAGARAYVVRRFLRRHWLPVAATAALFLALLAGLAGVAWQARRASAEARRAEVTRDFLIDVFKASDPRVAQDKPRGQITARELLDASVGKIDHEFAGDPRTQIQLLGIAADIYREQGEEQRYDELHRRYLAMARREYGDKHPIVLAAMLSDVSRTLDYRNDSEALRQLQVLDPLIRDAGLDRSALRARWYLSLGQTYFADTGKTREQFAALHQATDLAAKVAPNDPVRVTALADLGNAYASRMDYAAARTSMEQAITVAAQVKNRDDGELATIYSNLALIAMSSGDFDRADSAYGQAAAILKKTYGESSPHSWPAAMYRARAAHLGGNRERAAALFAQLIRTLPADPANHDATEAREWYASCLAAEGRAAEAVPLLEAAEHLYRSTRLYDFQLPRVRATLGDAYARVGRMQDARSMLKTALDQRVADDAPDFQPVLAIRERWGRFLLEAGELDAAEAQFKEVILQSHAHPLSHASLAQGDLARLALARGDTPSALKQSELAIETFDHVTGFRDVRMGPYLWLIRSEALRHSGDASGARQWAQRALTASQRYDAASAQSIEDARAALQLASRS